MSNMHKDDDTDLHFDTKVLQAGITPCPNTGALVPPIYQNTTYVFDNVDQGAARFKGEEEGYIYSRLGNPTLDVLEEKIAVLEGGDDALAFTTGMAAISALFFQLLSQGDHVITSQTLYGSTHGLLHSVFNRFGVEATPVDLNRPEQFKQALRPETRVVYFETPANPTMTVVDMEQVAEWAQDADLVTVVDNTFMSPYLQRPLEWGIDYVVHSATKFIGGHGDVLGGLIVGAEDGIGQLREGTLKDIGGTMDPFAAWLCTRGLKTLAVRMERHCSNAMRVGEFLVEHPLVKKVHYPGLPDFPQKSVMEKQTDGPGSLMSFEIEGGIEAGKAMMNAVEVCHLAVSLGDVDSLIQHPASMTHSTVERPDRLDMGISDGLIRLSVGIEAVEDIIADLEQALQAAEKVSSAE